MANVAITGGSGGIGYQLARAFSKRGRMLLINGTNQERLDKAKARLEKEFGREVKTALQDLSLPGAAASLQGKLDAMGFEPDILVNNAGMGTIGASEEIDFAADEKLMQLNMVALVQLCKLYLPRMYKRGSGKILNVASVAAFQPGPYNSTYFASKAFVLSYTRAIRFEAKEKGVQVCAVCPGSTKTEFFDKEGISTPVIADDPEKVAEYTYKKFMRDRGVVVPGAMNQLSRVIPTGLRMKLVAMMKEL